MFYKKSDEGYKEPAAGVLLKTLVYGDRTSMCEFRLKAGAAIPAHSHPHEQTGFVVSGRLNLRIGEEVFEAGPGDGWCIRGDVEHAGEALEDAVIVEVFSPVREDYITSE